MRLLGKNFDLTSVDKSMLSQGVSTELMWDTHFFMIYHFAMVSTYLGLRV